MKLAITQLDNERISFNTNYIKKIEETDQKKFQLITYIKFWKKVRKWVIK